MVAEAVVSFVVGKVGDLLIEEALLLHGVRDQFEWIERELKQMRCFLEDADARQKEDESIKNWVADIRDISYDAEDVIDTIISMVARGRRQGFVGLLKRYSCIFNELITRHKVGKEIQRIKLRIDDISRRRERYGIRDINQATSTNQNLHDRRRYFALLERHDVVGFEEDRKTLKEQLMNGDSRRAVISIVGMGGSGKTTLAKKIYRDIEKYFDCRAFIHLSQQYKIRDILIQIIQGVMSDVAQEEMEKANEHNLGKKLSDHLTTKRYLIVIDDIWTMGAWDVLKSVLSDGSKESRVILTTRIREVALHADPFNHPHEIRLLDDTESWELFLKKVFPPGSTCPSELEDIGRKILAKCGHLPLAIVVLGGLLSRKDKTLSAWSKVLDCVTWHLDESEDKCMEILALSYYDLPHYLKPCFLYLGLFPEDFELQSKRLIRLWIAEGFIQQIRGDLILEDVAEEYLEELIGRNMLQVASKRCNGSVRTCRIHDLLHDLSVSEAKLNNFFEIIDRDVDTVSSLNSKCRRVALHRDIGKSIKTLCHSTTALRSVLCFNVRGLDGLLKLFSEGGKLLRVFDEWDGGNISKMDFSKEMGKFVHLRYLSLRKDILEVHPSSVANLHNLQTLEVEMIREVVFPNAIYDLVQLRHLYAYNCEIEGQTRLNNLRNLQTLCIRAGSWIENGLDKLTGLRKLGMMGYIGLYYNSFSHSIEKLCSLRSLAISHNNSVIPLMSLACRRFHLYKMFLDGPLDKLPNLPSSLVKLSLQNSRLKKDNITKLEELPQLRILRLWRKWTCLDKWICSSPGFPQLETLVVDCENLKEFIIEEGAMPCLKMLTLQQAENLTIDPIATKNYSLCQSSSTRQYEIRSMASTVLGKDNAR